MSSLMQFSGKTRVHFGSGQVGLEFYRVEKYTWNEWVPETYRYAFLDVGNGDTLEVDKGGYWFEHRVTLEPEQVQCTICGGEHPRLYVAWRRPAGMLGCWVVFRYNGEEHVPDLSVPIDIERLPRDATPLTDSDNCAAWHRS